MLLYKVVLPLWLASSEKGTITVSDPDSQQTPSQRWQSVLNVNGPLSNDIITNGSNVLLLLYYIPALCLTSDYQLYGQYAHQKLVDAKHAVPGVFRRYL